MAKENSLAAGSFWAQLFQLKIYKKTQGRVTRQVTFAVVALICCLAAFRLGGVMSSYHWDRWLANGVFQDAVSAATVRRVVVLLVAASGVFLAYRLVNYTRFADFLISVEAEMTKVSWPSRTELVRSSIVVIVVMFVMAVALAAADVGWLLVLRSLGIRL